MSVKFYLGTHVVNWLWREEFVGKRLFVSRTTIGKRKSLKPAVCDWALDSGAFTELLLNGQWTVSPREYADLCVRLYTEVGRMDFCSIQDWMCEEQIISGGVISGRKAPGTGLTLEEHQIRTVGSYVTLSQMEPNLPWLPVVQGFTEEQYLRCVELYEQAGVSLKGRWVGVGSVCRRQGTKEIASVLKTLSEQGLLLHGFGVKSQGLQLAAPYLHSADSMAWSYGARRTQTKMPICVEQGAKHKNCANCHHYALDWLEKQIEAKLAQPPTKGYK